MLKKHAHGKLNKFYFFQQPDQPSSKRCRERFVEITEKFCTKAKKIKTREKFRNFMLGGHLPPGLPEGQDPSEDEDDDDDEPDRGSSSSRTSTGASGGKGKGKRKSASPT